MAGAAVPKDKRNTMDPCGHLERTLLSLYMVRDGPQGVNGNLGTVVGVPVPTQMEAWMVTFASPAQQSMIGTATTLVRRRVIVQHLELDLTTVAGAIAWMM